jgi:hypothetical protein
MKRFLAPLGAVFALAVGAVGPVAAAVTTNTIVPISYTSFVPCANEGAGEYVALAGNLHVKISTTVDGSGGLHLTESYNPQGVTGTGVTTGAKYQASGDTHPVSNLDADGGYGNKFEDIFRIVGPGPGNNLFVHENFHLKVDADGNVTLFKDTFSVTCK